MGMMTLAQTRSRHPRGVKLARIWLGKLRERLLSLLLTIQIVILFVMPSARAAGLALPHLAVFAILLIFVAVAIFLSRSRPAMVTMILSVALTIAGAVWRNQRPDLMANVVSTAGQLLTQISLLWVVSTAVFGRGRTTHHRILGAVVMYLCIGMMFITVDILLAQILPGAFTNLPSNNFQLREALTYFSFSTLTTASFGDIVPVHPIARNLANLESICGQLFPATLLARIVGLHSLRQSRTLQRGRFGDRS